MKTIETGFLVEMTSISSLLLVSGSPLEIITIPSSSSAVSTIFREDDITSFIRFSRISQLIYILEVKNN